MSKIFTIGMGLWIAYIILSLTTIAVCAPIWLTIIYALIVIAFIFCIVYDAITANQDDEASKI